jgi:hypothetical protein
MELTPQLVREYLDANPQIRDSTAEWLASTGDARSVYDWVFADMRENPRSVHVEQMENFLNDLDPLTGQPTDGSGTVDVPLEQGLLETVQPGLIADVEADKQRREIADQLGANVISGANAANQIIGRTQGGRFDGATYFRDNPDVAAAYERQGGKDGRGVAQTPDQFAEEHYLTAGQREGRKPAYIQSAQLAQDFANADATTAANLAAQNTATQETLAALDEAATAMQQNLTGNLAAKAAALKEQLATLYANLDTLDATQKKALTDQIAAQQANLEQSIATQRQALEDQVQALGLAADAQSVAMRDALTKEIAGLTAAQAPLAQSRLAAAELQATGVNVGLERTRDQLQAQAAQQGFVGGSTTQDAALARATIDARQRAAEAVGSAQVANAADLRDINVRGATGERSIADALANAKREIAGLGATGNAALTTAGAVGKQQLGDAGAAGLASIINNTGTARAAIGAQGANTTYGNVTTGADQSRTIADQLAAGTAGTKTNAAAANLATQQQGNAAKATYYDNDYNRSLAGALALPGIAGATASTLTGLDNYATSGLGRTQDLLQWWATPTTAAPTPGAVAVQPDTSGNAWGALGAGLVNAGLNIGNANNWWQKPKTPNVTNSAAPGGINTGGSNLYTSPLA